MLAVHNLKTSLAPYVHSFNPLGLPLCCCFGTGVLPDAIRLRTIASRRAKRRNPRRACLRARPLSRARPPSTPSFTKCPKARICTPILPALCMRKAFIREATENNLCVNPKTIVLYKTMAMTRSLPPQPVCGEAGEPAANALSNQKLYDQLINAFSMRTFVPTTEESGHDHFFASFDHFRAVEDPKLVGEWVDELASRAAAQNEQYLEIMHTPNFAPAAALAEDLGPVDMQTDFAQLRRQLLDAGLQKYLPAHARGVR